MTDIFNYPVIDIELKSPSYIGYDIECHQLEDIILNFIVRNQGSLVDLSNYTVELRVKKPLVDGYDTDYIQGKTGITKGTDGTLKIECKNKLTELSGFAKGELRLINTANKQSSTRLLAINILPSTIEVNRSIATSTITVMEELDNILNNAYDVQEDFENKIADAIKTKTDLETTTNIANIAKTKLDESNLDANNTKQSLDASNANALGTKSALDALNINADKTKSDLDVLNTNALQTKSDLTLTNETASKTKIELDTSNDNAIITKDNLNILNTDSKQTKSDLTAINTIASTTKTDLSALNAEANTTKTNLDESNSIANDTLSNLEIENTQATQNIEAMENFGDVTIIAKDVTDMKNEITDARGDYDNLNDRIINIIGKDVANLYIGDTEPELDGLWVDTSGVVGEVGSNDILDTFKNYVGDKTNLQTDNKTNIVNAINEHETQINNNTTSLKDLANPSILINGDFRNPVNQRKTESISSTGTSVEGYFIDRWLCLVNGQGNSVVKNEGFISLIGKKGTSCSQFRQFVEFPKMYRGKNVAISFKYRVSKGSDKNNVRIYSNVKGIDNPWIFNDTLIPDGEWHIYNKILSIPNSDSITGFAPIWISCINIDFNTLQESPLTEDCQIDVEWVKSEIGNKVTPFIPRPYGEELALCQRYFETGVAKGIAFGQNNLMIAHNYKISKRVKATLSFTSYLNHIVNKVSNFDTLADVDFTPNSINSDENYIANVMCSENNLIHGKTYAVYYKSDAEIY